LITMGDCAAAGLTNANATADAAAKTSLCMFPPAGPVRNRRTTRASRRLFLACRTFTEKVGERPLPVSRGGERGPLLRCNIRHGRILPRHSGQREAAIRNPSLLAFRRRHGFRARIFDAPRNDRRTQLCVLATSLARALKICAPKRGRRESRVPQCTRSLACKNRKHAS
jgi:hypothetical protein